MNLPQEPLDIRRRGSSPLFRYSCRHSLSIHVHGWVTPPLHSSIDAPLPNVPAFALMARCRSFGAWLSPVTLSAQDFLTSELLRTLSRMAASKPTSWLSVTSHILYHLAMTLGP
jgi:hypothetical protein